MMAQIDQLALATECAVTSRCATADVDQDALQWAATLDPQDESHEIEITDEMVCRAIAEIECEQIYPFNGVAANGRLPQARAVHKADVIPFPVS